MKISPELPDGKPAPRPVDRMRAGRVAGTTSSAWCIYADGYRRAADLLVETVRSTYELNTVIFPIVFLYRQYLELTLKEVVAYGRYLANADIPLAGGHNLSELWKEARGVICKHVTDVSKADLDLIQARVERLATLDPTSEGTRYPITKNRRSSFDFDAPAVNIDELFNDMSELAAALGPLGNFLSICQQQEADFRSDYYGSDY
jgi:hypothetical protein